MSSKVTVFDAIAYSPSAIGFVVLLLAVIFAWRPLSFIIACVVASLFHVFTYIILRGFVAYGEAWSGYGPQHHLPTRVLGVGFGVIGALIGAKILWCLGLYGYLRYRGRIAPRHPTQTPRYDY